MSSKATKTSSRISPAVRLGSDARRSQNSSCGEVAEQPERSRQAKMTIHGAACLRRKADRWAVFFRHEDRLDCGEPRPAAWGRGVCGWQRQDVAHGTVGGAVETHNLWEYGRGFARETLAQRHW